MNANETNQVIDRLAEKIGVAVNQLRPVTQELLAQTRTLGIVYVAFGIAIGAVTVAILIGIWRQIPKGGDILDVADPMLSVTGFVTFILGGGFALGFIAEGFPMLVAPLRSVLGL